MIKLIIALSVVLFAVQVSGYGKGAPDLACAKLQPMHKNWTGQETPSPYKFVAKKIGNDMAEVTIKITDKELSGGKFKGFICQGKDAKHESVGSWDKTNKARSFKCVNENDTITHDSKDEKETITLKWIKPEGFAGTVCFKGAVVRDGKRFWVDLKSNPINF